jgi:hypothetical protein
MIPVAHRDLAGCSHNENLMSIANKMGRIHRARFSSVSHKEAPKARKKLIAACIVNTFLLSPVLIGVVGVGSGFALEPAPLSIQERPRPNT